MTKAAAIHAFWKSFGIPAFEESSVPEEPDFPYITYQFASDSIGTAVQMTASVWIKSSSWVKANALTEQISKYIGLGGKMIAFNDGAIWIQRGSPFALSMGDDSDQNIKRKVLNISAEYLSAD